MKRKFWAAAVAGLVACGAVVSQDGRLAPTAPIVPAPVMTNGGVRAPATGNWGSGRVISSNNWSPLRSPVAPASAEVPPVPAHSGYAVPLPPAHGGSCGPAGCAPANCGRGDRSCWDKLKAWLGYAPCKSDLPKLQPTPYVTPLQGMFYCSTPAGCAPCGTGHAAPVYAPPAASPVVPTPMPVPMKVAGPVVVPQRAQPNTLPGTVVPAGFKQPK